MFSKARSIFKVSKLGAKYEQNNNESDSWGLFGGNEKDSRQIGTAYFVRFTVWNNEK